MNIPEVVAYPSNLIPKNEWTKRPIDEWFRQWIDDCDAHERRVYEATIAFIESVRETAPTPPAQEDDVNTCTLSPVVAQETGNVSDKPAQEDEPVVWGRFPVQIQ